MTSDPIPKSVKSLGLGKYKMASNTQVRVYLLGDTLLDTGPPNQWNILKNFILEHSPKRILLTHHHEDHAGNAARISEVSRVRIHIAEGVQNPLARGFSIRPYQRFFWGSLQKFPAEELPEEILTSNGHRLFPIRTPGHSPDHTVFFDPDSKWLFSGDLYVGSHPHFFRSDENLSQEIASLKKVLELDFQGLFCGHMGFLPDGRSRLETKLAYLEKLIPMVHELSDAGFSVASIAGRLLKKDMVTPCLTFGHFSQKNLIRACLQIKKGGS